MGWSVSGATKTSRPLTCILKTTSFEDKILAMFV